MNAQKRLLLTLAFIVGALSASMFGWLQPVAAIEVKNSGSQPIERLDIDYQGIGYHHGLIAQNLKPGQSIKFQWATDSEASYRLSATFADGTVIKGGAGYISRVK
jgi:capsid protein